MRLLTSLRSALLRALLAACSALAWLEGRHEHLKRLCLCAWLVDALRLKASVEGVLVAATVGCVTLAGGLASLPLAPTPTTMQLWTGAGMQSS